jgi:uncharacterized membrane protein YqiK
MNNIALSIPQTPWVLWAGGLAIVVFLICLPRLLGIVYIPHTQVGIVEKIWSSKGSLREGQIIARNGEAGFQAKFLRGGIHFGLYPWQYRIHKEPLVVVAEGKMAYVYARDDVPLEPIQTLGRTVDSNHFQDAIRFLEAGDNEAGNVEFCARVFTQLTWRCLLSLLKNAFSQGRFVSQPIVTKLGRRNSPLSTRLIQS